MGAALDVLEGDGAAGDGGGRLIGSGADVEAGGVGGSSPPGGVGAGAVAGATWCCCLELLCHGDVLMLGSTTNLKSPCGSSGEGLVLFVE